MGDEGMDYEGDTKVLDLSSLAILEDESTGRSLRDQITVDGFVFDLGPASIATASEIISSADFVLFWGPAGICEAGNAQEGMKRLVQACSRTPWVTLKTEEEVLAAPQIPPHVLVLGDLTTEWFLRFIDPDGSETRGDLVKGGVVSFACRDTIGVVGILGEYLCPAATTMQRRPPEGEQDWKYAELWPIEDEDEEEEESEEDED